MPDIESFSSANADEVYAMCERSLAYHRIGREPFMRSVLNNPDFDPDLALAARQDGEVAAFISALHRKSGELSLFATDENHRGKGIMGDLYERIEMTLRERGVERMTIDGANPFFSGLDLRYREAGVFLMRRLYIPTDVHYDQLMRMSDVDPDTSAEQEKPASEGVTFRRLNPDDAPALKEFLERNFEGWLEDARLLATRTDSDYSVYAAFFGEKIVAFATRDGSNFGPTGTAEDFRRKGLGSVLFRRACADVIADGHEEMVIQAANFMFYARAFSCPVIPVWRMVKNLAADEAVKKAKG